MAISGPEAILAAKNGSILLLDGVNARILRADAGGKISVAASDARLAFAQDMIRRQDTIYALGSQPFEVGKDFGSGSLKTAATESTPPLSAARLFESNGAVLSTEINNAQENTPPATTWLLTSDGFGDHEYRILRDTKAKMLGVEVRAGLGDVVRRLSLPMDASNIGSVALIAIDAAKRAYVRIEAMKADAGKAQAKVWVLRYTATSEFDAGFNVPDERMEMVPNRYLAVNDTGALIFLQSQSQGVKLLSLPALDKEAFLAPYRGVMGSARAAAAASGVATVPLAQEATPPANRLSRVQIMDAAEKFRTAKWMLNDKNYGDGLVSACAPERRQYWLRPSRLDGKKGTQISGLPYNWGGYMSVEQFNTRIKNDAVAGNICTCRGSGDCVIAAAAGVDCSGFVSQVWGVSRKTTISLAAIAPELSSYNALKAGDILNKHNSHVRLFASFSASGNGNIRAYESSVGCGGVCAREFTTRQMDGYLPRQAPSLD